MRGDRLLDHRPEIDNGPGRCLLRHLRDTPVMVYGNIAIRTEARPRAARELLHAINGTSLLGHPVIEHGREEGSRLDPQFAAEGGHQRLQFRGEGHALASPKVVQRLDPQRITRQDQLSGRGIRQREREHAAEPAQGVGSPGPPGLEHDLGVASGGEPHTAIRQLGAQLFVIVELAVVNEAHPVLC